MMNSQLIFKLLIVVLLICNCNNPEPAQYNEHGAEPVVKEGVLKVDGFNLRFVRRGQGSPLVVVGSSEYYSKAFSKDLEKSHELIFIDSRHFVPDCNPAEEQLDEINLAIFSEDLESVRKHLSLEKFGLVGHSIHGQIALDYASKYPELLNGLVIIGGVSYFDEDFTAYKDALWDTLANEERKKILSANIKTMEAIIDSVAADRQFAVSYHHNAPLYWANPNYDATYLLDGLRTCPQVFAKLFGSVPSKEELTTKLDKLSVPTLLILGKLDFAIPHKTWEGVIAGNENIRYVLMENASHNPHTEESSQKEFNEHLLTWMGQLGS